MSNALVPLQVSLPVVSNEQLESLEEVAKATNFLARIQLISKGQYVDTGKIGAGRWGIPLPGGEEIEDLGEVIDVVPFCYRPKAMDVSDREAIIVNYDPTSDEFKRIQTAPKNTGCMWGPSFFVLERSTGKLYELFFGNKSGRAEAGKLKNFLPTEANKGQAAPARLSIRYKKGKDFGWHVPVITKCSEPFTKESIKVTGEQIQEEREKFLNPPKEEIETVKEGEAEGQGRAR
jgi:hypothetical protein